MCQSFKNFHPFSVTAYPYRCLLELGPNPADSGQEVGYTLDKFVVHHRTSLNCMSLDYGKDAGETCKNRKAIYSNYHKPPQGSIVAT